MNAHASDSLVSVVIQFPILVRVPTTGFPFQRLEVYVASRNFAKLVHDAGIRDLAGAIGAVDEARAEAIQIQGAILFRLLRGLLRQ
jgi:hypothetical protein